MTDPLEAAAERFGRGFDSPHYSNERGAIEILLAFFRAAVGCPQCNGTKVQEFIEPVIVPCSYEHVEITVLGETIYADPDKAWWACVGEPGGYFSNDPAVCMDFLDESHDLCGWQPRWDAIAGGE